MKTHVDACDYSQISVINDCCELVIQLLSIMLTPLSNDDYLSGL